MRTLIANDDGVYSPGIAALTEVATRKIVHESGPGVDVANR